MFSTWIELEFFKGFSGKYGACQKVQEVGIYRVLLRCYMQEKMIKQQQQNTSEEKE